MADLTCPYCGHEQDVCHDDGHGYEEDVLHEEECRNCEKMYVFETGIHFTYEASAADCLNDGKHRYQATCTIPRKYTMMRCIDCDHTRDPTPEEWKQILSGDRHNCKTF
jgi:hypothetical protein